MAVIREDLARVELPPRDPKVVKLQGAVPDGLWDGCEMLSGGLGRGVFYTTTDDRPLRGPFVTGCWKEDARCYQLWLQSYNADQVVQFYMQKECVLPVTLKQIAAGTDNAYALLTDGTVLFVGRGHTGEGECMNWTNIDSICAESTYVVGYSSVSGMHFAGDFYYSSAPGGATPPSFVGWNNIVQLSAGEPSIIAGLRSDGTCAYIDVHMLLYNNPDHYNIYPELSTLSNIKKVDAGLYTVLVLFNDGTCDVLGDPAASFRSEVQSWTNIVDVACSYWSWYGLKSDGTIVSTGPTTEAAERSEAATWTNIKSIFGGLKGIIGIENNAARTCRSVSTPGSLEMDVDEWTNIQQCAVGSSVAIGMTSCNVFASGNDEYGEASGAQTRFDYCL